SSRKRTSILREVSTVDSETSQLRRDREINIMIDDAHFTPQTPPPTYTRTINHMGLPPPYTSSESDSINHRSAITSDYSSSIEEGTAQSTTSSMIQTPPFSYSTNLAHQTV
ncbi:16360_t:CDS:1, partial [Racocetra fulgida]